MDQAGGDHPSPGSRVVEFGAPAGEIAATCDEHRPVEQQRSRVTKAPGVEATCKAPYSTCRPSSIPLAIRWIHPAGGTANPNHHESGQESD